MSVGRVWEILAKNESSPNWYLICSSQEKMPRAVALDRVSRKQPPRCYLSRQPFLPAAAPGALTSCLRQLSLGFSCFLDDGSERSLSHPHYKNEICVEVRGWAAVICAAETSCPAPSGGLWILSMIFLESHSHPGRTAPGIPGCSPGKALCRASVCLISGLQKTYPEPPVSYISLKSKIAHLQVRP